MKYNIRLLLKDMPSLFSWIIVWWIILWLGYLFIDIDTIIGNNGVIYFWIERISHRLLSMLIGLFVATHVYRFRKLNTWWWAKTFWWALGSFLGVLITWCPSCSITLAWLIGLAGVFSALPFAWLEVKILWLLIMMWVVYRSVKDLLVCKVKKRWKA